MAEDWIHHRIPLASRSGLVRFLPGLGDQRNLGRQNVGQVFNLPWVKGESVRLAQTKLSQISHISL